MGPGTLCCSMFGKAVALLASNDSVCCCLCRLLTALHAHEQGLHAHVTGHTSTANEAHGSMQHLPLVLYQFSNRHALPLTRAVQANTVAKTYANAQCEQWKPHWHSHEGHGSFVRRTYSAQV